MAGSNDGAPVARSNALIAELACRAAALAHGGHRGGETILLPGRVGRRIDAAEARARRLAVGGGDDDEARRSAALDFVADTITALTIERELVPRDTRELVSAAAAAIGIPSQVVGLAAFRRALSSPAAAELPPPFAYRLVLDLVAELGPADAASLWTSTPTEPLACIASAGAAATSRRMRLAARTVLDAGVVPLGAHAGYVLGTLVERWDQPHAALIARGRPEAFQQLSVYLAEGAAALSPAFERERLFERNVARERSLVSASERRLTRLGCDLHDGPLQDLVALADELRRANAELTGRLDLDLAERVRGRFADIEARLAVLDQGLRDISHAVRSTSALEQPLADALHTEVDALNRTGNTRARLAVDADLGELTASQKIVLFRVVQEALNNARRHSGASNVRVRVRSTLRYISVTVSDDGCGFDVEAARRSGRLGLTGVIERVRLLGGDIDITSVLGRGTRVRVTLPHWSRAGREATPLYGVTA